MQLYGWQKLTLLDYPGKVATTVFTGGCNFCCPFCHNASLVTHLSPEPNLSQEEFFAFLHKRQGVLDGVCISGGEPLLQDNLRPFMVKIKELGYALKLDTNGSFPQKLKQLVTEGLVDYVAMDIKNSKERYALTCGLQEAPLAAVEESVEFLQQGRVPYELRTTVVRELHRKEDFAAIGQWLASDAPYFLQGFVDSGDLIEERFTAYSKEEMQEFIDILRKTMFHVTLRGI